MRPKIWPAVDLGIVMGIIQSRYEVDAGFGAGLLDACNACGELSQYRMMYTMVSRWNKGEGL